jgi:hypothetical protein
MDIRIAPFVHFSVVDITPEPYPIKLVSTVVWTQMNHKMCYKDVFFKIRSIVDMSCKLTSD